MPTLQRTLPPSTKTVPAGGEGGVTDWCALMPPLALKPRPAIGESPRRYGDAATLDRIVFGDE